MLYTLIYASMLYTLMYSMCKRLRTHAMQSYILAYCIHLIYYVQTPTHACYIHSYIIVCKRLHTHPIHSYILACYIHSYIICANAYTRMLRSHICTSMLNKSHIWSVVVHSLYQHATYTHIS